jgi:hypothetical protein
MHMVAKPRSQVLVASPNNNVVDLTPACASSSLSYFRNRLEIKKWDLSIDCTSVQYFVQESGCFYHKLSLKTFLMAA